VVAEMGEKWAERQGQGSLQKSNGFKKRNGPESD